MLFSTYYLPFSLSQTQVRLIMVSIKPWQIVVLGLPIAAIIIFLLVAAGSQIHDWGINWIWGVVVLVFAVWRWLLVKWTKSPLAEMEEAIAEIGCGNHRQGMPVKPAQQLVPKGIRIFLRVFK